MPLQLFVVAEKNRVTNRRKQFICTVFYSKILIGQGRQGWTEKA